MVADVLVGGEEQVKLRFGEAEQLPILDSAPPAPRHRHAFVTDKQLVDRPGDAFIQQDSHAEAGVSNATSEHSRTRQAISRVTDGKHSRNSSSV